MFPPTLPVSPHRRSCPVLFPRRRPSSVYTLQSYQNDLYCRRGQWVCVPWDPWTCIEQACGQYTWNKSGYVDYSTCKCCATSCPWALVGESSGLLWAEFVRASNKGFVDLSCGITNFYSPFNMTLGTWQRPLKSCTITMRASYGTGIGSSNFVVENIFLVLLKRKVAVGL